jgi:hypothetical protein
MNLLTVQDVDVELPNGMASIVTLEEDDGSRVIEAQIDDNGAFRSLDGRRAFFTRDKWSVSEVELR